MIGADGVVATQEGVVLRRAYEGVGFDRPVPIVEYWQDLEQRAAGSELR